jgi:uncharacterized membrane protein YbhN (UPF0104 family)
MATMLLLATLVLGLLFAIPGLRGVVDEIRHIGPGWVALAVALELGSAVSFVVLFGLFFDRLPARDARGLAWTTQGSGALLPGGGAGGLAVGGVLTHLAGLPIRWVARRSAGVFFVGGAASGLALVGSGLALIAGAPGPDDVPRAVLPTAIAAVGILLIGALPIVVRSRRAPRWLAALATGVREAEGTVFSRRPNWRLIGSLGYLGFDIAVLWVLLAALGPAPSVAVVVMAYSIGYAANALPIPGGIGVLDAGLTGALALYGISPVRAAAAVIVYHAIAFWIPGLGGLVAYLRLRPRLLQAGGDDETDSSAKISTPTSKAAPHDHTRPHSQTNRTRLGGDAHRRPRARPLHRPRREAQSASLPRSLRAAKGDPLVPVEQQRARQDPNPARAGGGSLPAGENRQGARRAAERHYLAVVAAEARRLARELRPLTAGGAGTRRPIYGEAGAEAVP